MNPDWNGLKVYCISTPTVFPVGEAHVYLYEGPPVTLFDAGTNTDEAFAALEKGLSQLGFRVNDIQQILVTHHHLDHMGLSARIRRISGAKILAHSEVARQIPFIFDSEAIQEHLEKLLFELGVPEQVRARIIENRMQYNWMQDDFTVDEAFEDGAEIDTLTAYFRPGHSASDTVYAHREQRWAITGDHLIHKVTPNPLLRRCHENGVRVKSLVEYYNSLFKTRDLDISWCFAGHGHPFQKHREAVDATVAHIERRSNRMLKFLPTEGATPYALTCRIYPRLDDYMLYYCLSAVTGHLEFLEERSAVISCFCDGIQYYFPVRT